MFANADRYPGYWFSCELLLFFFFLLLLLIAGIDDDDGSSSSSNRMSGEKEKNERACCKHPHICRRVDHRMSLLVAATFLSRSLFLDQTLEKEKRDRDREKGREEKKKIVHPIADARGRGEFCRLACTSLYDAGGHDWSKTENEQI
jgi:hypothetical protein